MIIRALNGMISKCNNKQQQIYSNTGNKRVSNEPYETRDIMARLLVVTKLDSPVE